MGVGYDGLTLGCDCFASGLVISGCGCKIALMMFS